MTRILGLSGSLRAQSSNAALVRAALALVPAPLTTAMGDGVAALPPFNPDDDFEGAPTVPALTAWRMQLRAAAGYVMSVPEYAHGLPGAFKNALDWIVSSGELTDKPVLLLNASAGGGERAQASLAETLTVMGARVLPQSLLAPWLRGRLAASIAMDAADATMLARAVGALVAALR